MRLAAPLYPAGYVACGRESVPCSSPVYPTSAALGPGNAPRPSGRGSPPRSLSSGFSVRSYRRWRITSGRTKSKVVGDDTETPKAQRLRRRVLHRVSTTAVGGNPLVRPVIRALRITSIQFDSI